LHNVELDNRRHKAPAGAIIFIDMTQYLYRFQSGIDDITALLLFQYNAAPHQDPTHALELGPPRDEACALAGKRRQAIARLLLRARRERDPGPGYRSTQPGYAWSALPDGQFAHGSHAAIARRAIVSQARGIAEPPKSAASFRASRLVTRGVSRSSRT
jgi:hypothetical protein